MGVSSQSMAACLLVELEGRTNPRSKPEVAATESRDIPFPEGITRHGCAREGIQNRRAAHGANGSTCTTGAVPSARLTDSSNLEIAANG